MKSEKVFLAHIFEAASRIAEYTAPGRDYFATDKKTQDAVIKVLSNLTESASHLDKDTISLYPDIPWGAIKAFRNVLVHEYLGTLDFGEVWDIIQQDLPLLVTAVKQILKGKYGTEL